MNRIITLLLCVVGINVHAQMTHPQKSSLEEGKVFYLYNLNKRGFLVGGNKYGTQASIAHDRAFKIRVKKWCDEDGKWDGETYLITDSVEQGQYAGGYRNLFIESDGNVFVDQAPKGRGGSEKKDCLWGIIQKNKSIPNYSISVSYHNKTQSLHGMIFSAQDNFSTFQPVVGLYEESSMVEGEWCFVTPEDARDFIQREEKEQNKKKRKIAQRYIETFQFDTIHEDRIVYLYNIGYDGFLKGSNSYNTRASLSRDNGVRMKLHRYIGQNGKWDGVTYFITDSIGSSHDKSQNYKNLFVESDGQIWIDQQEKTAHYDCLWTIYPKDQKMHIYNIKPSRHNRVFTPENLPDYYLTSEERKGYEDQIVSLLPYDNRGLSDWLLLTEDQYNTIMLARRRQLLQELIWKVEKLSLGTDVKASLEVCNDIEGTKNSDVEQEIGKLRYLLATINKKEDSADEVDFTFLIKNNDFSWKNNIGWQTTWDVNTGHIAWTAGYNDNLCAEAYQTRFDYHQMINGVPNGLWRVNIQAFNRSRICDLAWLERDSTFTIPVVYVNEMVMPMNNLMKMTFTNRKNYDFLSTRHDRNSHDAAIMMLDGTYALNNIYAVSLAFQEGFFDQSIYCYVLSNSINIGIMENYKRIGSWTAWDNVRLTYLPENKGNYLKALNCYLEKAKETKSVALQKGIDVTSISTVINRANLSIAYESVDTLRVVLHDLNESIKDVRVCLAKQEFGADSVETYIPTMDLIEEEQNEQLGIDKETIQMDSHNLDYASGFIYIAGINFANCREDLAMKQYLLAHKTLMDHMNKINRYDICVKLREIIYGLYKSARYDECMEIIQTTLDKLNFLFPSDLSFLPQIYCFKAETYEKKKLFKDAEETYLKVIDAYNISSTSKRKGYYDREMAQAYNQLAYSQAYQEHYKEALLTIERAIELQPTNPNYYNSKGEFLYMKGNKEGAKEMWEKVISLDPGFAKDNDSKLYQLLSE